MEFINYFCKQLSNHPSMQSQDVIKLCFQAAFGAEHLLSNLDGARNYFYKEYEATPVENISVYESISDDFCRVNIAGWKYVGLNPDFLFNMFVASVIPVENGEATFLGFLDLTSELISKGKSNISAEKHKLFIQDYLSHGIRAVHHSQDYRDGEKPAYRIVNRKYMKLLPILEKIGQKDTGSYIISIDGPAASGKSTLSKLLADTLDAGVIHMDDFFLPPELRTGPRLAKPGGNVHYERFISHVLMHIRNENEFSYNAFDCSKMAMGGPVTVKASKYRSVEGSYSNHPLFGDYADLKIFIEIDKNLQKNRILDRNGPKMWERFNNEWIPMEDKYFHTFSIPDKSDIKIRLS